MEEEQVKGVQSNEEDVTVSWDELQAGVEGGPSLMKSRNAPSLSGAGAIRGNRFNVRCPSHDDGRELKEKK